MNEKFALIPLSDVEKMANTMAKSGLFGVKSPDQAMALMLIAQAEGLHPAIAARDYHIIEGRPSLKADAMLARFQQAGGSVVWEEMTATRVAGIFAHPQGGSVPMEWTYEMAQQAGLTDKGHHKNTPAKNNWDKYPRAMLRARCISEGVRATYPGVTVGMYTKEEVLDMTEEDGPTANGEVIIDTTATTVDVTVCITDERFDELFPAWEQLIIDGKKTSQDIIDKCVKKGTILDDCHIMAIRNVEAKKQ